MANESSDEEEQLVSKGLYRLVSDIIGSEVKVKLRREHFKVWDFMTNNQGRDEVQSTSGSMAEGFYFKTSDFDMMYWSTKEVVVNDFSQFIALHPYYKTILMMDCDFTSPGFVLVRCISRDDSIDALATTCVWKCDQYWVSSKLFMQHHLKIHPTVSAHGPCQSGEVVGREYDIAQCLKCAFWPTQAVSSISRMRRCGWPAEDIIREMINDGCLLVPVASKKPLFEGASDLEWRISFSLAEKRLIHSMNQCQFLCYGLWKLFLSEVIKKLGGLEDILCSYFLKTLVFWEISRDPCSWTPSNYISKFTRTLKMLIDCVNIGSCPNFFITDNNMFFGKVCGEKQKTLITYLREFYNEGFLCLLRCPSLQNVFLRIIRNPLLVYNIPIDEAEYISQYSLRIIHLHYICMCNPPTINIYVNLHELSQMQRANMSSDFMSTALAIRGQRLLQDIAERTVHEVMQTNSFWNSNKRRKRYLMFAFNMLRDNKTYLGYSELIIVKSFYLLGNYRRAIHTANIVKSKLQNQNVVYEWTINEECCNMLQTDELALGQFIELHVATNFILHKDKALCELYPEIIAHRQSIGVSVLYIPPLVLAYFLLILSHHKMNDAIQMYDVLRELHALVHHDDNFHIFYIHRAISWQILGICQQLCREYPAAYDSYINALVDRYNDFKTATIDRLNSLQNL